MMSRWQEVLGPDDFSQDVPMNPSSGDERGPDDYRHPPPPAPRPTTVVTHGVRRQRDEMTTSPDDEDSGRRQRYSPAGSQDTNRRRYDPVRQNRTDSATSSQASSSKSSYQRVHFTPQPQRAQSLQMVTRVLPPISVSEHKVPTAPTHATQRNGRNVHASVPAPVAGCGLAGSCPAMHLRALQQDSVRPATSSHASDNARGVPIRMAGPSLTPHTEAQQQGTSKRFNIRTDLQFDKAKNLMTATLELPGLTKSDIKVTLHVCPFSRIQHLTIAGTSRPEDGSWALRERKYGDFGRTILVPPDTKSLRMESSPSRSMVVPLKATIALSIFPSWIEVSNERPVCCHLVKTFCCRNCSNLYASSPYPTKLSA
ncbi:unnamed protein product [Somion occarium]|uniref:SHSP domain-containing protein n=1 Tax=Somion occarium TaxID=3059160 RepID=A0ABP1DAL0_9APHY